MDVQREYPLDFDPESSENKLINFNLINYQVPNILNYSKHLIHFSKINFTINSFINPKHSIPAFLIQPLVENAIWHGLDYSEKGIPEIILTFRNDKEGGFLVITVEDNGGGLSTSNSISQPSHKSAAKRQSHGLRIIKERLKLISPKASLHLDNRKEERGCIATISIPS